MSIHWKTTKLKNLAKAFLSLETKTDVLDFMRDLCTLEELEELSSRWKIVHMLDKKIPYRTIAKKTGVSTTTITRIAYWFKHGNGGYRKALKHIKK